METTIDRESDVSGDSDIQTAVVSDTPRFVPEPPGVRKSAVDVGMWLCGHVGVGLQAVYGSRMGSQLGIITYHRVASNVAGIPKPLFNVTPERFRQQIVGLLNNNFTFIPLSVAVAHHASLEELPDRSVVLTFDDGFESVYTHAWPVLREYEVPATIF